MSYGNATIKIWEGPPLSMPEFWVRGKLIHAQLGPEACPCLTVWGPIVRDQIYLELSEALLLHSALNKRRENIAHLQTTTASS